MQPPDASSLKDLPTEIKSLLGEQHPAVRAPFLELDREFHGVALTLMQGAGRELVQALSSVHPKLAKRDWKAEQTLPLFMKLLNRLHDDAEHLNCDEKPETGLPALKRIEWECSHYQNLVQTVAERAKVVKEEDFKSFVEAVVQELGEKIPLDMTPRQYWHTLKNSAKIKGLTTLNLFQKGIRFLPPEISLLVNLTSLHLASNKIKELPAEFSNLYKLQRLDLSDNQLAEVPEELTQLPLLHLQLDGNRLHVLPSAFALLLELRYLDLSGNPLGKIPEALGYLSQLEHCYLNKTELTVIDPSSFPPKLKEVCVSKNQITDISAEDLASLGRLRKLFLYQNPLNQATQQRLTHLKESSRIDVRWFQDLTQLPMGE